MPAAEPRGRQGRAYTQQEIETLLRDALTTLMDDGTPFRSLSVDRLAAEAGLARSTFYLNYDDKAAMLRALSATSLAHLYEGARRWVRKGPDATREDIATGMRETAEAFIEDHAVMRAAAEASVYEPSVREAYAGGVEGYAGAIERMIRRGVKAGRMRDVDPPTTAFALAWLTEGVISRVDLGASPKDLQRVADTLADIVWRTLFA